MAHTYFVYFSALLFSSYSVSIRKTRKTVASYFSLLNITHSICRSFSFWFLSIFFFIIIMVFILFERCTLCMRVCIYERIGQSSLMLMPNMKRMYRVWIVLVKFESKFGHFPLQKFHFYICMCSVYVICKKDLLTSESNLFSSVALDLQKVVLFVLYLHTVKRYGVMSSVERLRL